MLNDMTLMFKLLLCCGTCVHIFKAERKDCRNVTLHWVCLIVLKELLELRITLCTTAGALLKKFDRTITIN